MDSINLSETRNTPLNSKSTASSTNTAPCGCCALIDYAQILPQAHYYRALNPGLPKCKHFQDNEEKLALQQQFFPSLPLFQPFFHNSVFPSSSCCFHMPLNDSFNSEQQTQLTNEQGKIPQSATPSFLGHKESCSQRPQSKGSEENGQNNCGAGPEMQYFSNPYNFVNTPDSQVNSFYHRCGYNDAFPWSCNSFVVPIISYCVLWNSQKSNMSICGNYACATEPLSQKKNENLADQKYSKSSPAEEVSSTDFNEEKKNESLENFYESVSFAKTNEGEEVSSFVSHSSSSNNEENIIKNSEQTDENVQNLTADIETVSVKEEDREKNAEETNSDDLVKSEESSKTDEKDASNSSTISNFSNDPYETYLKDESQLPSGSQSFSNLKKLEDDSANISGPLSATIVSPLNISVEEKESSEGSKNEKDFVVATSIKKKKKVIQNFTITDQIKEVLYEDLQMTLAAAGDLGGDSCVGYKVNIAEIEENLPDKIGETKENFQSEELFSQVPRQIKKSQNQNISEKNTQEIKKKGRTFKSGIAKFSHNLNSKESKGDPTKNNHQKESIQKDFTVMKRKHSCFQADNTLGLHDSSSKIQKTRNLRVAQQQVQGLGKQQKTTEQRTIEKGKKTNKTENSTILTSKTIKIHH